MQVPGPSIRNSFRMHKGLILDDLRMKTSIDDAFAAVSTVCGGPIRSRANLVLSLSLSPSPVSAAEPLPLMDLCRRSVRLALGKERLGEIHTLPLPASLKAYLLYQ